MRDEQLPWRQQVEAHLAQIEVALAEIRAQIAADGAHIQQLSDRIDAILSA